MAIGAVSDQMVLRYIAESTYGVTPTDGTWTAIPFTGESLFARPIKRTSNIIRSDRMELDDVKVGLEVGGAVNSTLQDANLDDFIEAVMMGTWTTNVVKIGTTNRQFSIEKELSDLSTVCYIVYKGLRVNAMDINIAWGEEATCNFEFIGNGTSSSEGTSLVGLGSTTAYSQESMMNGADGVTSVKFGTPGGTPAEFSTHYMRGFRLRVDNRMTPQNACKVAGAIDVSAHQVEVTGGLDLYVTDLEFWDRVINNTGTEVEVIIGDGTNTYTINLPNLKFGDGDIQAGGSEQDLMQTLSFRALYYGDDTSSLVITRSA